MEKRTLGTLEVSALGSWSSWARSATSASARRRRTRCAAPRRSIRSPRCFRRHGPRFTGENLEANLRLARRLAELAEEKAVTAAQLALAWVLAQGTDIVPIPGTKRREYLEQNAGAVDVQLTGEDLARIEAELGEAAGDRYDESGMASVNL
jgi:aryl-alcohol dehydrogenase-like predicted oxidoreductase